MPLPFNFKDPILQRAFEYVNRGLGALDRKVAGLRDDFNEMKETGASETSAPVTPPKLSLPKPTGVVASKWYYIMRAKFDRINFWRFKKIKNFEWAISYEATGSGTEEDPWVPIWDNAELAYSYGNRIFHILDNSNTHFVRVRCIGVDGSEGPWSDWDDTVREGIIDETPPDWPVGGPQLTCPSTDAQFGYRFTKLGKALLTWKAATDNVAMHHYVISYRKTADTGTYEDVEWQEHIIRCNSTTGLTVYSTSGENCFSWIHNLQLDAEYEFRIMAVDWIGNDTGFYATTTTHTITKDTAPPATLVISAGHTKNEKGLIAVNSVVYLDVHKNYVPEDSWFFTVQYKLDWGAWGLHQVKWIPKEECLQTPYEPGEAGYVADPDDDNYYHIPIEGLIPNTTYKFRAKQTAYNFASSASWSNEVTKTTTLDIPTPTIVTADMIPLWTGWLKKTHYRVNVEITLPDDGTDWTFVNTFEFQFLSGEQYRNPSFFKTAEITESFDPATDKLEFNFDNFAPSRTAVPYSPGVTATTGWQVMCRAWVRAQPGTWDDIIVSYGTPATEEDVPDLPAGYPKWNYVKGSWRAIWVQCEDGTWDYPNNFSHFTIHARIKGGSLIWKRKVLGNWVEGPDHEKILSIDRVGAAVTREQAINGVWCHIPVFVADNQGTKTYLNIASFQGGGQGNLEVKVWPHLHTYNPILHTTTVEPAANTAWSCVNRGSSDEIADVNDDIFSSFLVPVKAIAMLSGDCVFAPCGKLTFWAPTAAIFDDPDLYTLWIAKELAAESARPFVVGDILGISRPGAYLGVANYEIVRVTQANLEGIGNWWFTVQRGICGSTKGAQRAGDGVFKIGTAIGDKTYRFIWMDANTDRMRIVKTVYVDDSTPLTTTVECEFGAAGADGSAITINDGGDIKLVCTASNPSQINFNDGTSNYFRAQGYWAGSSGNLFIGPCTDGQGNLYLGYASTSYVARPSSIFLECKNALTITNGRVDTSPVAAAYTIRIQNEHSNGRINIASEYIGFSGNYLGFFGVTPTARPMGTAQLAYHVETGIDWTAREAINTIMEGLVHLGLFEEP